MNKKIVRDLELEGKRVLMRVDFNVPLDVGGNITDDTRIRAALPTIQYILDAGASLVLMSHLGRPKGEVKPEYSLKPAAVRLSELLGKEVAFAPDCIGEEVKAMAEALQPAHVLLLENLRFHAEEKSKGDEQEAFAEELASLGEVYVNDAFGTAHRAHASMAVVTKHFDDCVAGFLLEKEIEYLGNAVASPERPFVAILGGAKVSDKIGVIENLLSKVDRLLIGGAMAYAFLKAKGISVGASLAKDEDVEAARGILPKDGEGKIMLPVDHVAGAAFKEDADRKTVESQAIDDGWMGLDIGPKTVAQYTVEIAAAKTLVWNGPMGAFEMAPFAEGTLAVTRAVAANDACVSIIGGGDSVSAVNKSGLAEQMTHISTGGGASLEFLEGKELPGLAALSDK